MFTRHCTIARATATRWRSLPERCDTANATETNLALAASKQVEGVDFETVWGQGHTMAERTGSSTENFIKWVNDCCK